MFFVKFSRSVASENSLIQVVIFIRILVIFRLQDTIQALCLWTNQVRVDNPACFHNTATLDLGNKYTVKDTDGNDCLIGRYVTRVSYALWLEYSFPGMEFGELHLCPDSTPPSRERGRSGCHKRKNLFWSCGQYSKGTLLTSVSLNCNSVLRDQFSTERRLFLLWCILAWCGVCVCVPIRSLKYYLKKGYTQCGTSSSLLEARLLWFMLIWNSSFVSPRFGSEVKLKLFDQAKLKAPMSCWRGFCLWWTRLF